MNADWLVSHLVWLKLDACNFPSAAAAAVLETPAKLFVEQQNTKGIAHTHMMSLRFCKVSSSLVSLQMSNDYADLSCRLTAEALPQVDLSVIGL